MERENRFLTDALHRRVADMRAGATVVLVALASLTTAAVSTFLRDFGLPAACIAAAVPPDDAYEVSENRWRKARLHAPAPCEVDGKVQFATAPEPLAEFAVESRFRRLGETVGRVQVGSGTSVVTCSGVFVAPDLVLTAAHCFGRGGNAAGSKVAVRFGLLSDHDEKSPNAGVLYDVEPAGSEINHAFDFAVLKLAVGRRVTSANVECLPLRKGQDLFLIGHPLAKPLSTVRKACRVVDVTADPDGVLVKHSCGTAEGMSGAPVFDDESGAVLGIHVSAPPRLLRESGSIGYIVPMAKIASQSVLLAKIFEGPGSANRTACDLE